MPVRPLIIITAIAALFCGNVAAQDKHYEDEYSSGYRGGYIKNITVADTALNFLVVGDWGRCGEYYQKEVAQQMANASVSTGAAFIISTGDNFYPGGVASVDDPLWNKSFEDVYSQFALQKNWYVVLGNHDYKINPQAEVDYSKKSIRWQMPQRYYSQKINIDGDSTQKILLVFMDTNPLIDKYYQESEYTKNVKTQDTAAQRQWLVNTLADKDPNIRWRFVVGHHPMYTSGKRMKSAETLQFRKNFESIFDSYKVDAYICGHEHQLEHIKPSKRTQHFISGAGSEIRPVKGELAESKFKASDHGFLVFSVTPQRMKVFVVNWEGKILYEQSMAREK